MDTLLRETVNAVVNSRFPEMSIEGRRQIESILIREEYPKGVIALNDSSVKVCSDNTTTKTGKTLPNTSHTKAVS